MHITNAGIRLTNALTYYLMDALLNGYIFLERDRASLLQSKVKLTKEKQRKVQWSNSNNRRRRRVCPERN